MKFIKAILLVLQNPVWQGIGTMVAIVALFITISANGMVQNPSPQSVSQTQTVAITSPSAPVQVASLTPTPLPTVGILEDIPQSIIHLTIRSHVLPAHPNPVNPAGEISGTVELTIDVSADNSEGFSLPPELQIRLRAQTNGRDGTITPWRVLSENAYIRCIDGAPSDCVLLTTREIPSGSTYSIRLATTANNTDIPAGEDTTITVTSSIDLVQTGLRGELAADATLRILGPEVIKGTLRVEVYEDVDNNQFISQEDRLFTLAPLLVNINNGGLVMDINGAGSPDGVASTLVQSGKAYWYSGFIGLADGYMDVSDQCANIAPEHGGCRTSTTVPAQGQATVKLLVRKLQR